MRHPHAARHALALLILAIFGLGAGAEPNPASSPKPMPCTAAEYRQFDFWLGEWDVVSTAGGSGVNRITRICEGCALREEYASRITRSRLGDGRVRQLWESSADGEQWTVVFDGTYTRRPVAEPD